MKTYWLFFLCLFLNACAATVPVSDPLVTEQLKTIDRDLTDPLYDAGPAEGSPFVSLWNAFPVRPSFSAQQAFGPVWYRGRLEKDAARVIVLGAATGAEEMITRRAFSGTNGLSIQNLLARWGTRQHYLFLNVWPWPANPPASRDLLDWQGKLLGAAIEQNKNSLSVLLVVGETAKAALEAFAKQAGIVCPARNNLENCDASNLSIKLGLRSKLLVVGLNQTNGFSAGVANADKRFREAFPNAESVPGGAVLPASDFAFGTPALSFAILGGKQLISSGSAWNREVESVKDAGPAHFDTAAPMPGQSFEDFLRLGSNWDPGPCKRGASCPLAQILSMAQMRYRGNVDQARVLVLSDFSDADDYFTGRLLTGNAGQKLQGFLQLLPFDSRYFLLSCPRKPQPELLLERTLREAFPLRKPELVLVLGACRGIEQDWFKKVAIKTLPFPGSDDYTTQWNRLVTALVKQPFRDGKGFIDTNTPIPRQDLPFGWPAWMGTTGSHGHVGENQASLGLPAWMAIHEE